MLTRQRLGAALAAAPLALVALAAPAVATTTQPRGIVTVTGIRACVSTTWRAAHTGQPLTRRGELCYVTTGMWIPASWHRIGIRLSADGSQAFEVWQRPW